MPRIPKPTNSADGRKRFNLNVTFRVSVDDMIIAVAVAISQGDAPDKWGKLSVIQATSSFLQSYGYPCGNLDMYEDEDFDKATEIVNRLFPEYKE
jgi:hypothetical protein